MQPRAVRTLAADVHSMWLQPVQSSKGMPMHGGCGTHCSCCTRACTDPYLAEGHLDCGALVFDAAMQRAEQLAYVGVECRPVHRDSVMLRVAGSDTEQQCCCLLRRGLLEVLLLRNVISE